MAEEDLEQDESTEETGGSKKKLIIMIAGGVVLLAIIAGAGMYFTGFFDAETPVAIESVEGGSEDAVKEAVDEASEDTADEGEDTETLYQALTPHFMVNFPSGGIKMMKVKMSLMASDSSTIDAVKLHDPVIRNNILLLLSTQDPEVLKTAEGKTALQQAVKDEINKVLAERKVSSKIKEVFFTDLVMQ